ncbi:Bifunctional purine biosynthetic protein ade1 [Coelomomyces lativittatus]|nr:Bifunctional purine biosynthetic protein ade1 [Coelomomyces lativittatus]
MASEHADARGLILVDTKFEFGQDEGTHDVYLADEVLTPDSTRYWLKSTYPVDGQHLPDPRSWLVGVASLDKQPLRDYLKRGGGGGNEEKEEDGHRFDLKAGQGIEVPMHLVKELQVKYATCLAMLTGRS